MTNTISKIAKTLVMGLALSTSTGVYAGGTSDDVSALQAVLLAIDEPINTAIQRANDLYQMHGISGLDQEVPQVSSDHTYLQKLDIGKKYGVKITFKNFTGGDIIPGSSNSNDSTPVPNFLSGTRIIIFAGKDIPLGSTDPNFVPVATLTLFECATDVDDKVKAFYGDIGNKDDESIIAKAAESPYLTGCASVSKDQMDILFATY